VTAPALTPRQRAHLRSLAHALRPVVQVGQGGVDAGVLAALDRALLDHELVKVKLTPSIERDRHELAAELATGTKAALAQVIGRVAVLYRPRPAGEGGGPRLVLPAPLAGGRREATPR
jgi:RNA-binding protein